MTLASWRATLDHQLAGWLGTSPTRTPAAELAAVRANLSDREDRELRIMTLFMTCFHVVMPLLDPLLAHPGALDLLMTMHAVVFVLSCLWFRLETRGRKVRPALGWLCNTLTAGAYAYSVHLNLLEPDPFSVSTFKGGILLANLMFYMVLFAPSRAAPPVMALSCAALAFFAWSGHSGGWQLALLISASMLLPLLTRLAINRRIFHECRLQLALIDAAVRAKQDERGHEHRLALALRDSMTPPQQLSAGSVRIDFHRCGQATMSGDWFAVREMGPDDLVLLSCDVAEEGIQAGIILHAIQSLWAQALCQSDFDPRAWLVRVNQCMLRMGVNKRHAATIGIARIERERVSYWSAGHVALLLVSGSGASREVRSLAPVGRMLGVAELAQIGVVTEPLGRTVNRLLLRTDGVTPRHRRFDAPALGALLDRVEAGHRDVWDEADREDDASLAVVSFLSSLDQAVPPEGGALREAG